MFPNYESEIVLANMQSEPDNKRIPVDEHAVPNAVFTYPHCASVGLSVEQAKKDHEIMVGKALYRDIAMGYG